ncbi:MAG: xanthine dehydrogenase FAD-binding subunit XdhB [Sphaerochaetaceae bacterium]|jgi:xanthine dehydrogenase FAD-binding subunit|nr:xanthine dehydrogenase FAD-binding subunit XdhB [Sphaerochaetaceae bacterium]MDD3163284.1 xanthine dehydrogenase FAD-binding subunit XdhB [Sphaerochaetaceae bacterium]MDD4006848.1 xanthine dehydrogenase FAD-binding subunit XdhB [Sphaerochaetaceae bacterium]MDD4395978.1 xanthine dehydrogenase FAD-binding subunit XdhB [Sphaerochaetaceae bacterium]
MYDFEKIYQPKTIEQALKLKAEHPEALILAGGSDILIKTRSGKLAGSTVISIYGLDELRGVCIEDDGTILIRPLTSFSHITANPIIAKYIPVLGEAVDQVGGPQIRNIGTIGGNICNGVTSADSASTLKAYDAVLEIASVDGIRILPYAEFNLGPGKVDLHPNEILTGIRIPKDSYENTYGQYIKYSQRNAMDIATLGCSVNVRLSADCKTVERLRIAFGVAAPTPIRALSAEKAATGAQVNESLMETVASNAILDVNPRTSWRASKEFRMQLISELSRRATRAAVEKAGGKF